MKLFNILFILLFIVSAALQYNDPDPYIWIPIYLFAAYLCVEAIRKNYPAGLYAAALIVYSIYAVFLFFDKTGVWNWATHHHFDNIAASMKADKPWIEETREFFGLLIVISVLLINRKMLKGKKLQQEK